MWQTIKQIVLFFIPRYEVDFVAGYFEGDDFTPICSMEFWDYEADGQPPAVAKVKVFTWFGVNKPIGLGELVDHTLFRRV